MHKKQKLNKDIKTWAADNAADLKAIQSKKSKKSKAQVISGVIFTLAMTALIVTCFLSFGDIQSIGETFARIAEGNNYMYLIFAFLLTLVYFFLWPLSLLSYARALDIKAGTWDIYCIGVSEQFYNDVTPGAAGGQPYQVYALSSIGVDTGKSTGAVLATYVTYLLVTNLYALVALVFFPYYIKGVANGDIKVFGLTISSEAFIWIIAVGYFLNTLNFVIMALLGLSKRVRHWIIKIAMLLGKLKFLGKFINKQIPNFIHYCENTQSAFKEIMGHKKQFWFAFSSRFIAMGAYYAIPYFIMLAVGLPFENAAVAFWAVLFGTSFAITAVCWLPTPGTTGGIEIAFAVVIGSLSYMDNIIQPGYLANNVIDFDAISLMWRMFTFYLIILLSLIFSISFEVRAQRRMRKEMKLLSYEEDKVKNETITIKKIEETQNKPPKEDDNPVETETVINKEDKQ
jgi:uncharacterized protein (TIRG00374 family)